MTYKELLEELKTLTPEQLEQDAIIQLTEADEFVPRCSFYEDDAYAKKMTLYIFHGHVRVRPRVRAWLEGIPSDSWWESLP